MAKLDDLIEQMRNNPNDVRFPDACKVADALFGKARQSGSHKIWKIPWAGDPRVNLQEGSGGKAKSYQVQQLLVAVDRRHAEVARAADVKIQQRETEGTAKRARKKGRRS